MSWLVVCVAALDSGGVCALAVVGSDKDELVVGVRGVFMVVVVVVVVVVGRREVFLVRTGAVVFH